MMRNLEYLHKKYQSAHQYARLIGWQLTLYCFYPHSLTTCYVCCISCMLHATAWSSEQFYDMTYVHNCSRP
jgi:hypothetical protein